MTKDTLINILLWCGIALVFWGIIGWYIYLWIAR